VVEAVDRAERQVKIAHDDIPGFMPAMTMSFDVAKPALLEGVARGDRIRFRLEYTGTAYRILAIQVLSAGEASGQLDLDVAAAAEPAPLFSLTDQDGIPRSLPALRGRTVLLDFIYTHCPGPCPTITARHVAVQRGLPDALRDRVWFVSISLDPRRDTAEARRAYAEKHGADLANWSFLGGEPDAVLPVVEAYGVGRTPAENGEIDHVVATFLIDREGNVVRRYFGTRDGSERIGADLAELASGSGAR
jgi:protein SCO1/2